jgi:cytoskeletal protein CcmA (bactofilin family)
LRVAGTWGLPSKDFFTRREGSLQPNGICLTPDCKYRKILVMPLGVRRRRCGFNALEERAMALRGYRKLFSGRTDKRLEKEVGEAITVIAPDTVFTGDLTGHDTVRIAGRFDGNIDCKRLLWVESSGRVNGNVVAKRVINEGEILGDILAADHVEIRSSGRMVGDIHAVKISVAQGSQFDGRARMTPSGEK